MGEGLERAPEYPVWRSCGAAKPDAVSFAIRYASRTELVACGGQVVVRLVEGHWTETEDIDRLLAVIDDELGEASVGGLFQVFFQGSPPLTAKVRRYAARALGPRGDRVVSVFVVQGLGFWKSSLDEAIDGFAKLSEGSGVILESSIEAGAQRLALELVGLNPEALCESCLELQAHMRGLSSS